MGLLENPKQAAGLSFSSQTSLDVSTSVVYRTAGWEAATAFDSTFGGQAGAPKTNRQDLTLRTTLGGGYGRYLKRTTNSHLSWLAGVAFIDESFDRSAGRPSDQNAEALVGLQYSLIRFNFGQFDSQLLTFPGLTDTGRVRVTTNNSLAIKLRNNFHFALRFCDNFDSRPPATAKRNELGGSDVWWSATRRF